MGHVTRLGQGTPLSSVVFGCGGAGSNAISIFPASSSIRRVVLNDRPGSQNPSIDGRIVCLADQLKVVTELDKSIKGLHSEVEQEIVRNLSGAGAVFVIAGLGGDTGTYGATAVSRVASIEGKLNIVVTTFPFSAEGSHRREIALAGLKYLRSTADAVVVLHNDGLLKAVPHLPLAKALNVMSRFLSLIVLDLTAGIASEEVDDLRRTLRGLDISGVGIGEGRGDHRCFIATEEALKSAWMPEKAGGESFVMCVARGDLPERFSKEMEREVVRNFPTSAAYLSVRDEGGEQNVRVTLLTASAK